MDPVESVPRLPGGVGPGPHSAFLGSLMRTLSDILIRIAVRLNSALPKDGTEAMTAPIVLASYTVATRPAAASWAGGVIYVSDGGAGAVFQGSDGSAWVNLG